MTAVLCLLAILADETLRYVAHHRTGLTTALATAAAWAGAHSHIPLFAPHSRRHARRRTT